MFVASNNLISKLFVLHSSGDTSECRKIRFEYLITRATIQRLSLRL